MVKKWNAKKGKFEDIDFLSKGDAEQPAPSKLPDVTPIDKKNTTAPYIGAKMADKNKGFQTDVINPGVYDPVKKATIGKVYGENKTEVPVQEIPISKQFGQERTPEQSQIITDLMAGMQIKSQTEQIRKQYAQQLAGIGKVEPSSYEELGISPMAVAGQQMPGYQMASSLIKPVAQLVSKVPIPGLKRGLMSGITAPKEERVSNTKNSYTNAIQAMGAIETSIGLGADPTSAIIAYNEQLKIVRNAERILKYETGDDLNRFLSGGADELADIENWNQNIRPMIEQRLQQAILKQQIVQAGLA